LHLEIHIYDKIWISISLIAWLIVNG
jgi:hypothetical protein